jgi:hypothetical protein
MWDVLAKLTERSILYPIAWTATLLCVLIAATVTLTCLRHTPRLFTAMALFTCAWMLVLGAYGAPDEPRLSDLATDLAAFLNVYIGGLLVAEAQASESRRAPGVSGLQTLAMSLLLFIALPRALEFPDQLARVTQALIGVVGLDVRQTKLIVSEAMVVIGFWALWRGARDVSKQTSQLTRALAGILICYALLSAGRSANIWFAHERMGPGFIYGFALAKLALTVVFSAIVVAAARVEVIRDPVASAAARS